MREHLEIDINGQKVTGWSKASSAIGAESSPPLVVSVHGGGFTSAYFDCGEYSLHDRLSAAGCPSVGINRPGYGDSTALPPGSRAVPRNAELLAEVIGRLWHGRTVNAAGVVLVGHSIGSATVLHIAGMTPDWPLLGVAISGILRSPPSDIPPFWTLNQPDEWVATPKEQMVQLMFGPPDSYPTSAPDLCHEVSVPAWWREIQELYSPWEDEAYDVCAKVSVPVHYRHGELDPLWQNRQDDFDRFASAFTKAPSVDARRVPHAGHCIDFHIAGSAFHDEQVAFTKACAMR